MYIYVAGPLMSSGDLDTNIRAACRVGTRIKDAGHVPFVPHTNVYWNRFFPAPEESWLQWDFAWLRKCDALVRIPGHSRGADREESMALDLGLIVCPLRDLDALLAHPVSL
jgi:hypothetical protein